MRRWWSRTSPCRPPLRLTSQALACSRASWPAARRAAFTPLVDGDALASQVDQYVVAVVPQTTGYLYVFQVDTAGKSQWLHPRNSACPDYSSGSNPVAAGGRILIPPGNRALTLDTIQGVEHVYFVLSAVPWKRLEEALASRTGRPARRRKFRCRHGGGNGTAGVGHAGHRWQVSSGCPNRRHPAIWPGIDTPGDHRRDSRIFLRRALPRCRTLVPAHRRALTAF